MSNRMYHQFHYSLEKDPVELYLKVAIGGTGAPTLSRGKGFKSVTRNSAGNYTVVLQDKYQALLDWDAGSIVPSTGLPAASTMALVSEDVKGASAAPNVVLQCSFATAAGNTALVAKDPASGETLFLRLTVSRTTAL